MKRTLEELTNTTEPAWPLVQQWIGGSVVPVEVLPPSPTAGDSLVALQVTTRSPMGAIVLHTGGLLVDHGWLRVLGSGHPRLDRSLPGWNQVCGLGLQDTPPPALLVADDALGGFFALDGGQFGSQARGLCYFGPDTLAWQDLGIGYSQFLCAAFGGGLAEFYQTMRWPGWEKEVEGLPGDRALHVYPPLSAAGPPIAERSRRPVPVKEMFDLYVGAV